MASRRSSRILIVALVAWAVFGAWALFRPEGDLPGFDPLVGHGVVFFFVSLATFGLLVRPFGVKKGLAAGGAAIVVAAGVSELLQPVLTATRQAQFSDLAANGVGIAGGLVASLLLAGVLRTSASREVATAGLCFVGLAGSAALIFVGADRVAVELECRGRGFERMSSSVGEPIIEIVGETVMVGDEQRPLNDGFVASDSIDLRCSVMRSGSYSIVATVVPASIETGGPMRIFASSRGTDARVQNTHIGQEFDMLSVRIGFDGELQWESVPDVFVAGERVTVAMVVGDGQVTVFVDGEQRAVFDLGDDSFAEWDAEYPLLIGDELSRDRTFEGTIETVSVFDRMLSEGDAALAAVTR